MKCVVGIDLGSTTTKAVLLDESGTILGKGITNSRSNYEVACSIARDEAITAARFGLLERACDDMRADGPADALRGAAEKLKAAFRLELYLDELAALRTRILELVAPPRPEHIRQAFEGPALEVLDGMRADAPDLFLGGGARRSDFFRDIAGAAFVAGSELVSKREGISFDRLVGMYDRAILDVETRLVRRDFDELFQRALSHLAEPGQSNGNGISQALIDASQRAATQPIDEVAFVGTGYGRQTLPFPKRAVRSEILCHGRGAHRVFPKTRTVLDIGGQDTKAIQVDDHGVVTSFQMNDRCAAGCGRYLGYIADELNLGLHELGPLAMQARRVVRVNSTCTVFAGAELRERLALGQRREDILAGLHRAILLRAMSLLARSGGIDDEFTFTGGVCKNPMATKLLRGLVTEHYGEQVQLNAHPDSIYMGALGAALFALDDLEAGTPSLLAESATEAMQ